MNKFNENLIDLLKKGTCIFTCIEEIKKILINNGYRELKEDKEWNLDQNKYFVIRNDASLIAFNLNQNYNKFKIICTHGDTPSFNIKPNPEYYENGYLKLNIAPYGGILNYGFMDRPMSIAGRIVTKNKNIYEKHIIDLKETVAIIPSIAIHQNDSANSNLDLNTEIDLMPIISQNKSETLENLIQNKTKIKNKLFEYEKGAKSKPNKYKICTVNFTVKTTANMTVDMTVNTGVDVSNINRLRLDKDIYINLFNIYKKQIENKPFFEKIKIITQCKKDKDYEKLSEEEQEQLFLDLMSLK